MGQCEQRPQGGALGHKQEIAESAHLSSGEGKGAEEADCAALTGQCPDGMLENGSPPVGFRRGSHRCPEESLPDSLASSPGDAVWAGGLLDG